VADGGFPGLVVRVAIHGLAVQRSHESVEVTAGAGESWQALVKYAVSNGWAGLECLAGIPGRVGATPIQNVGAYGQEVRQTIVSVVVFDLLTGEMREFGNAECEFGYRSSRFKRADRGRYIVLKVRYRLIPGGPPIIRYLELERRLAERDLVHPTLAGVHATVLELRQRKSMLLDAHDPNARSAGSFFINPVLTPVEFSSLETALIPYLHAGEWIPRYPTAEGCVKVPAAWLTERAGFSRGFIHGNVGLSSRHALALINRGGATACELAALARDIRNRVRDRFGITLIPEPAFVGLSLDEPCPDMGSSF
jgi:UDP-N-acetylmuramate dehydrogenase